jgi:hypothetical protein
MNFPVRYIAIILLVFAVGCLRTNPNKQPPEVERLKAAYAYLLTELHNQNIHVIASRDDKNPEIVQRIIDAWDLNLDVERVTDLEKRSDLCYYSKLTGRSVGIITVEKGMGINIISAIISARKEADRKSSNS